jgi:hypothetical protein
VLLKHVLTVSDITGIPLDRAVCEDEFLILSWNGVDGARLIILGVDAGDVCGVAEIAALLRGCRGGWPDKEKGEKDRKS